MSISVARRAAPAFVFVAAMVMNLVAGAAFAASTQGTAFAQAVAEGAQGNAAVAAFYRDHGYAPIFTGKSDRKRRAALLNALAEADMHGLPASRYDAATLEAAFRNAKSPRDLGKAEALAAQMFVQYSQDIQSGAMTPSRIDSGIVRALPRRDQQKQLEAFAKSNPTGYIKALPPQTRQYNDLLAEKLRLEKVLGRGGWGATVPAKSLKPGQSDGAVVALRNRLIAMGYMGRSASQVYDGSLQKGVQAFQLAHGLNPDGIAGPDTIAAVNVSPETRLSQVIVAMERERWTNMPLGKRHIIVNIPEFTARVVDNGKDTFVTRAVVGQNTGDRRTPEFSDMMEFMVVNPSWYVPRSIVTKEYLPMLQKNRNAASQLKLVDSHGRVVSRSDVNFSAYTAANFPYSLQQPPSERNALGQVKFMFPNPYNIYLHDTPSKSLFAEDRRDYSHGCVRLGDPFEFAYVLLAPQTSDPQGLFQSRLHGGGESRIVLDQPVPVHLIYRTAHADAKGRVTYLDDVYGRDAKIWQAMQSAGVSLRAAGG